MTFETPGIEKETAGKGRVWKYVAIALVSAIVIICVVFAISFMSVPVEVTETYTETEYKQEAYTEREPHKIAGKVTESKSETFYDNDLLELGQRVMPDRWGTEVCFTIDLKGKLNPVVLGSWEIEDFTNAVYVTITDPKFNIVYRYKGAEAAPQFGDFQFVPEYSGMYVMRFSTDYVRTGKYARLTLALKWDEAEAGASERIEYREVTKYRQVPVQVEKQKTVTKLERASIWSLLFR